GAADLYVVASLADVPSELPFVVVPLAKGVDAGPLVTILNGAKLPWGGLRFEKVGGAVVGGSDATRKRLKGLKSTPRADVAGALAGASPLRLVLVPTRDLGRILEETMPTLPDEVGGGSVKPLSRGLRWLALGFDPAPKRSITLTAQAADAPSAKALAELASRAVKALAADKEGGAALPGVGKLVARRKPAAA